MRRSALPTRNATVSTTKASTGDEENEKDIKVECRRVVWFAFRGYHRPWRRAVLLTVLLALALSLYFLIIPYAHEVFIRRNPTWLFPTEERDLAIFYHIYIPPNKGKKGVEQALDILREQIDQIGNVQSDTMMSVYFTTTGVAHVAKRTVEHACYENGVVCNWMGHWTEGQEEVTLTRLYTYCHSNPASTVSYLHTKGSYHTNKGRNHGWRFHLTKAALTCAMKMKASSCNVCGLQFYPVWTTFFPGNMFSGSCEYINQLWAPHDFGTRLENVVADALESGTFLWTLFNASNPGNLGLGRYAMEHWIASHPIVRPCEIVTKTPHLEAWYEKNATQVGVLSKAPQHGWLKDGWFRWNKTKVEMLIRSADAHSEYFLLPGFLYKWRRLYSQIPPGDSWVWHWYPSGREFKARLTAKP